MTTNNFNNKTFADLDDPVPPLIPMLNSYVQPLTEAARLTIIINTDCPAVVFAMNKFYTVTSFTQFNDPGNNEPMVALALGDKPSDMTTFAVPRAQLMADFTALVPTSIATTLNLGTSTKDTPSTMEARDGA